MDQPVTIMADFDDVFASLAVPVLAAQFGDAVQYLDDQGAGVELEAIVGEERSELVEGPTGRQHRRIREFTLFTAEDWTPGMRRKLQWAGWLWSVEEIMSRTESTVHLRAVRIERAEASRPDYRHRG